MSSEKVGFRDEVFVGITEKKLKEDEPKNDEVQIQNKEQSRKDR